MREFDVVILGAGAAGLMAAIAAGRRGRRTLLLDHAERVGSKILISGGGRSNFTNLHCTHENFLSENPDFARSALARFTPADMVALVEDHRIPYHEKTLGQLFCDRSSRDLVTLLERECGRAGVSVEVATRIVSLHRAHEPDRPGRPDGDRFEIRTSTGHLRARSVVVATGGLSIPKMGASGLGYDLARQFGLGVVDPWPALVPLTFSTSDREAWCDLAGVAAEVIARTPATVRRGRTLSPAPAFREKMLITHRGLSGPAILQISSYWRPGQDLLLDLVPGGELLERPEARDRLALAAGLRSALPARLAERILAHADAQGLLPSARATLSKAAAAEWFAYLHAWPLQPAGTEGFAKAEVTAGGVATGELNPQTLESLKVPGLYFIGEVVDVTGWLGGYNFQWAWASGFVAGRSA